jgi:hypothetical protein
MLTPFDLLARGWAGQSMTCRNTNLPVADAADFAARVEWMEGNSLPKPTLAEVEARRVELQAAYDLEQRQGRWRDELTAREDKLLQVLEVYGAAIADLQSRTPGVPNAQKNAINTVNTRLAQIRAIT